VSAAQSGICTKKAECFRLTGFDYAPEAKPSTSIVLWSRFQKPARAQLSRLVFPAVSFLPHEPSQQFPPFIDFVFLILCGFLQGVSGSALEPPV
jgi:hypothetical protein